MTRVLAAVGAVVFAVFVAQVRYGPFDLRPRRCRCSGRSPMPAFTHPTLKCWVCVTRLASRVVEAKALAPLATDWDFEVESYYQLCCDQVDCLKKSAAAADAGDGVHVDTRVLTRTEAQAISGRHLEEAS